MKSNVRADHVRQWEDIAEGRRWIHFKLQGLLRRLT